MTVEDPLYAPKAYSESQDSGRSAGSKRVPTVENHTGMKELPIDNATEPETLAEAGPTGDRIDPEKVLELPSGTILHLYKKNSYCGKAMILNVNGVPEIYLGHKKDHLWKTRPLRVFKKTLFLQGANGVPYVVEVGKGEVFLLITRILSGLEVLARIDGYPLIYKSVHSAQDKVQWCKIQGIYAEVSASNKVYYVEIKKVPDQLPEVGAQPQDFSHEKVTIIHHDEFIQKLNNGQVLAPKKEDNWQGFDGQDHLTLDQHQAFMKKLYQGEANIGELKQAFQHFVASKDSIQKELEVKTVKELSEYGFTHAKKKSEIVKQILHNMMDKYAPGGGVLWQPFSEKYEEAVQKHINRLTDYDIQNVAGKIKSKKEFHAKATTNPETIEEYKHFIRHQGEDLINPFMEDHYQSLLKQKADQEAAEKAKIPPKIETKEVGFHGHFLADKKGIKVFANHEEAKAEAEKLQGFGFNAHQIGGIVKISNKGDGPPKLSDASVKKAKVGKDTWYANDKGMAHGFEDEDEALVVAHKLQSLGHNAVSSGKGILFKDSNEAPKIDFTYHETTHTKHGHPLFVAKLTEKVDKPTYSSLLSQAKKLGGYYSSFSQGGAVPGFTFKDKDKAQQFMAVAKGEEYKPEAAASSGGPASMTYDSMTTVLAVHQIPLDDPAMDHEIMRINTMSDKALESRIYKIKDDQKLHNFWQALAHKNKVHLAAKAMEELKARANVKLWGK